jgi:hypothetical protein
VLENGQVSKDDKPITLVSPRNIENHRAQLIEIQKQLEIANSMMAQNDEEIKRQTQVIETA